MKKIVGSILTIIGIILLVYSLISFFTKKTTISPVPLKEKVEVIQLSPSP